jgi:hypothetical protein
MAVVQISDAVVPDIFTPYSQNLTAQKSALIQAGVLVADAELDRLLAGGGLTFEAPSWKDVGDEDENISNDDPTQQSAPNKIGTIKEIAVRLNRNQSWSTMDLTQVLAGSDPAAAIAGRVAAYWTRRLQACFIAVMKGIFADNAAAPTGTEHVLNDLTNDVSGSSYSAGVTDFSAGAFLDAAVTMGDSQDDLGLVMVHSIVYNRMQKNNLIDFIPDSEGRINIPTFLNRRVVVDDGMPNSAGVFQSWMFGLGAVRFGRGNPPVPTETKRNPDGGNGAGQETLYNRIMWCLHPKGHKYAGSTSGGGPSNLATSNNLAHAGSWQRVFPERKQVKIARLITREY